MTSDELSELGKTEYVWIIFFGNLSLILSKTKLPNPLPVPPAIECVKTKPSKESLPSASHSTISNNSSSHLEAY